MERTLMLVEISASLPRFLTYCALTNNQGEDVKKKTVFNDWIRSLRREDEYASFKMITIVRSHLKI